jgi:NADPH:quinone reductase-like Zn-dependent oxidoreductase
MRNLAICGRDIGAMNPDNPTIKTLDIAGVAVTGGFLMTADPVFDPSAPAHREHVLLRTTAFSCNYRDKALILRSTIKLPPDKFYVIGSEFVGEVLAVGDAVTDLHVGDRVIAEASWPGTPPQRGGLPTNQGSHELQIIHHQKLIAIPQHMPDDVAAAFTIGGQTSYSMIRKLALEPGAHVLVTAVKSNTSLFAIQALRQLDCTICATSTSEQFAERLADIGVHELFIVDRDLPSFAEHSALFRKSREIGGFDAVIDPFFDLHLGKVQPLMGYNARYTTCGMVNQFEEVTGRHPDAAAFTLEQVMGTAMVLNHHLIGNCLGTKQDLQRAIDDYARGSFEVVLDSVFGADDAAGFLERTYNARDRFGKVVYVYE